MLIGRYDTFNEKNVHAVFLDYVDAIDIPIIDYVAIGVQDTIHKISTSMMSRLEWQATFNSLDLAAHDPVRKASFNACVKMFTFDELDFQDSYGREVMRQRERHALRNGLVIMDRGLGHNFMLTLATGYRHFMPHRFYVDHHQPIQRIFADLIKLISPLTIEYQNKRITHQSVDAK